MWTSAAVLVVAAVVLAWRAHAVLPTAGHRIVSGIHPRIDIASNAALGAHRRRGLGDVGVSSSWATSLCQSAFGRLLASGTRAMWRWPRWCAGGRLGGLWCRPAARPGPVAAGLRGQAFLAHFALACALRQLREVRVGQDGSARALRSPDRAKQCVKREGPVNARETVRETRASALRRWEHHVLSLLIVPALRPQLSGLSAASSAFACLDRRVFFARSNTHSTFPGAAVLGVVVAAPASASADGHVRRALRRCLPQDDPASRSALMLPRVDPQDRRGRRRHRLTAGGFCRQRFWRPGSSPSPSVRLTGSVAMSRPADVWWGWSRLLLAAVLVAVGHRQLLTLLRPRRTRRGGLPATNIILGLILAAVTVAIPAVGTICRLRSSLPPLRRSRPAAPAPSSSGAPLSGRPSALNRPGNRRAARAGGTIMCAVCVSPPACPRGCAREVRFARAPRWPPTGNPGPRAFSAAPGVAMRAKVTRPRSRRVEVGRRHHPSSLQKNPDKAASLGARWG